MAVAARVVGDPVVAVVFATLDVAAEGRRAALLDGCHHLELGQAQMPGTGLALGDPMAKKDICDLQLLAAHGRRLHPRSRSPFSRWREPVERAGHSADRGVGDPGITSRGVELGVAKQHLDDADVGNRSHRHPRKPNPAVPIIQKPTCSTASPHTRLLAGFP
jgi:hypothetical protein